MAMLDLLAKVSNGLNITLAVAHLNHNTRGDASRQDAVFVAQQADQRGIRLFSETVDVPALARSTRRGLEEAGRDARYLFFRRAAHHFNANRVALAHTADDQVETFVMRVGRGAGLRGLSGIPIQRALGGDGPAVTVIRPLLHVTRSQILDYCRDCEIPFSIDETNADPAFLRNQIRHGILPPLKEILPQFVESVSEAQEGLRSDFEFIHAEAAKILPSVVIEAGRSAIVLDAHRFTTLHRSLQYYVLLWAIEEVGEGRGTMSRAHFKRFLAQLGEKDPWTLEFPGGVKASYRAGRIQISSVG